MLPQWPRAHTSSNAQSPTLTAGEGEAVPSLTHQARPVVQTLQVSEPDAPNFLTRPAPYRARRKVWAHRSWRVACSLLGIKLGRPHLLLARRASSNEAHDRGSPSWAGPLPSRKGLAASQGDGAAVEEGPGPAVDRRWRTARPQRHVGCRAPHRCPATHGRVPAHRRHELGVWQMQQVMMHWWDSPIHVFVRATKVQRCGSKRADFSHVAMINKKEAAACVSRSVIMQAKAGWCV